MRIQEEVMKKNNDEKMPANEILSLDVESEIEQLENIVAPGLNFNHNETAVIEPEIELEIEELEDIVAPGLNLNHNETVVSCRQ
jgi:hypothetical protein